MIRINPPIIRSGVALLDDWLSGVREGGAHLLTGGTGSGKSTIALNFAHAALVRGERVAMLVSARLDDLYAHAAHLGVDLDGPLTDGRLALLRYSPTYTAAVGHALSPDQAAADLECILKPTPPARIVIDGLGPFATGPFPVAPVVEALMRFLERSGATSLLTFPERLTGGYDRTLEPIVQNSAAIIHLTAEPGGVRRAEVSNIRYAPPSSTIARFVIHERPAVVVDKVLRTDRRPTPIRTT